MSEPKPRGRPRTFDRQAALDTAVRLFWKHGYEGTSIADLTDAMGITPPTLYAAFGSKEQLYREALASYLSPERQGALQALDAAPAYRLIEDYLRRSAISFTDPAGPTGCMVQTAVLTCAAENEAAQSAAADARATGFAVLVALLERAIQRGELPVDTNAVALARFYSAIVQGMSVQAIDGATAAELNSFVDIALAAWPGRRSELEGRSRPEWG